MGSDGYQLRALFRLASHAPENRKVGVDANRATHPQRRNSLIQGLRQVTVPSQTPEAAGLEEMARLLSSHLPIPECPDTVCLPVTVTAGDLRAIHAAVVTAASAQAAIDAEKAKVAELEARIEYLRGSRDGHAAQAHAEFVKRTMATDALISARAALHHHYVEWDGEPEDAVPLQEARSECDRVLAALQQETQP